VVFGLICLGDVLDRGDLLHPFCGLTELEDAITPQLCSLALSFDS